MSIENAIADHAAAIRELAAAILGRASAAPTVAQALTVVAEAGADEIKTAVEKGEATAKAEKTKVKFTDEEIEKMLAESRAAKNAVSTAGTATAAADTRGTAGAADTATDAAQTSYDYAKDVQPLLVKVGKNRDQLVALLKSFGAARGVDIKPADYAAVIAKANELIAG